MPSAENKNNILLREFINKIVDDVLKEQDGGDGGDWGGAGDYSGGDYGAYGFDLGGYGGGYGGGGGGGGGKTDPLYATFIKPFVDVGKTIAYGIEKLSRQTQTVLKVIFLGLPTLVVPFLEYDYKSFRQQEAEEVKKIEKKYEEVLKGNWQAIESNDAFGLAFLLNPAMTLGSVLALKAPEATFHAVEILAGGPEVFSRIAGALHTRLGPHPPPGSMGVWQESVNEQKDQSQDVTNVVQNALKNPKVIQAINNNPLVKEGQQAAINLLVNRVKSFMAIQNYDQLRKIAGPITNKLDAAIAANEKQGKMPAQEDAAAKAALVPKIKQQYKNFYIGKLNEMVKTNSTLQSMIQKAIKQIQAMK